MSNAKRKPIETGDIFKPAGLLIAGPWNWCARPKPERRKPRRSGAKQLRLDLELAPLGDGVADLDDGVPICGGNDDGE